MIGKLILAAVVCGGVAAPAAAQFPQFPRFPPRIPFPPQQPGPQLGIEGRWFYEGHPGAPCYIEMVRDPRGPQLVLTNEKGERSAGALNENGTQIVAYNWGNGGFLVGDVRNNAIFWQNGTQWFR
jgi:hypothetical protein